MPTSTTDSVTGIVIPTPEQRSGPQYAQDISNALLTLAHLTHTGAANLDGYQIPSAGLNINADVSFQSNNLTTLRSARFSSQGSPLGGVGDLNCFYVSGGEAWFNDSLGNQIQLTSNGVVNVTADNNLSVLSVTANHTINSADGYAVIECHFSGATKIVTLPLANTVQAGRFYYVKDAVGSAATTNITVIGSGSDTVDGAASISLNLNYKSVLVMSDGTSNWLAYFFGPFNTLSGPAVTISAVTTSITETAATSISSAATTSMALTAGTTNTITAGTALTLVGQLYLPTKAVTSSPYTVDTTTKDVIIYVDSTSGAISINLPAASNGRILFIQDIGGVANTNNITLVRSGSDTIQGVGADYVMDANYQGVILAAYTGNSWFIIGTS